MEAALKRPDSVGKAPAVRHYEGWQTRVAEAEVAPLALRYQAGMEALRLLEARLGPVILSILRPYGAVELPGSVTPQDLQQQSRMALAGVAQEWGQGGSFLAYFFRRFPSEMAGYIRRSRRAEEGAEGGAAASRLGGAGLAALEEELVGLPERDRQVIRLRSVEGLSTAEVGRRLGVGQGTVGRIYRQGWSRLGGGWRPDSNWQPGILRVVRALHVVAGPNRRLPGRRWVVAATGLSRSEVKQVLAELEAAGAVEGRYERVAGRLVERTWAATLARVDAARRRAPSGTVTGAGALDPDALKKQAGDLEQKLYEYERQLGLDPLTPEDLVAAGLRSRSGP